jgi:uncharacterized membrane protein YeaQ/YmgE (transglycosylase-associated protein family)
MHFIGWIIFGLIVGALARLLMPGRQPMGFILTCLLGIAGSFIGGYIGSAIHGGPMDATQPAGWIGAVIGALILLFLYGMFAKSTAGPPSA